MPPENPYLIPPVVPTPMFVPPGYPDYPPIGEGRGVSSRSVTGDAPVTASAAPAIWSDLPGYRSPVNGQWIDGRAARRDDLKRTGCREADPSERPTGPDK